ncbi:hypothetical protein ACOSP7_031040 [Xanthoceras sorbifolium]|uniref:Uncharacterized protein n=1 Tax=Xanthoceras sorbifolium TaxID=99658 RepID=A0ABQ8H1B6_9ROSI|nr:hypothetical protein JRO89_XS15G0083500 [Xanthoceras sorbifolium]
MARLVCVMFFIALIIHASFSEGCSRKLLSVKKREVASSLNPPESSSNPPSLSTGKGYAMAATDQERLVAAHLSNIDRSLQSVPSPGVGH